MVALLTSTNFFALGAITADTKVMSPTGGQSKSSNYILDYGTYLNQNFNSTTTKIVVVVEKPTENNCDSGTNCNPVATVKEIDLITQSKPFVATTSIVKASTNIILRNLIYLLIGLILISIILILTIRFIRIKHSLNRVRVKNKNKHD